jgi:lysophospholipase L1-like esterase
MLHYGTPNLWPVLDSLKLNVPDIVVIKAGTNETVSKPRYNWEHIAEFEKDYAEFIRAIRKINPDCQIILCSPLDIVLKTKGLSSERSADLIIRRPRIWELRKRVKLIAKEHHAFFLDLTRAFKGKADFITEGDGVHPNVEGYRYLGSIVFDFLQQRKLINFE